MESLTSFDSFFQKFFYCGNNWLIAKSFHKHYELFAYTLPKVLVATVGATFFLLFLGTVFLKSFKKNLRAWQRPALLIALSVALVPLAVALFKYLSGVFTPNELIPYGGAHKHIGFLEHLWLYGNVDEGRGFPAGHASGGFALMSLVYLPLGRRVQTGLFLLAFALGWGMGLYQMARGEHFLSHTFTTMFLALTIITFLARKIAPRPI